MGRSRGTAPCLDLDQDTPEEVVAALVDDVRRAPERRQELVALLPERLALYAGRSTNATIRIRGWILAAFEDVGLPEAALPFVLEELESGRDAYLVAAAAKALRGLERPADRFVGFLFQAIENIRYADDALTFSTYLPAWPNAEHTTALGEILRTFAWLGGRARSAAPGLERLYGDPTLPSATREAIARALEAVRSGSGQAVAAGEGCPGAGVEIPLLEGSVPRVRHAAAVPAEVELEDQAGRRLTFGDFFRRRPTVVVFFYTRCPNPSKCSLTITKLAALQEAIRREGLAGRLGTAAITYDPEYDLAPRLKAYGENRGVTFDERHRFLRTTGGFGAIGEYFQPNVNFGPALVNRHAIELFILDEGGRIAATLSRLRWDVGQALDRVQLLLNPHGALTGPGPPPRR